MDRQDDSTLDPRAAPSSAHASSGTKADALEAPAMPIPNTPSAGQPKASQKLIPSAAKKVHWLRGGIPFVLGGLIEFCLAAADAQFRWGVPVGILATAVSVWGLLDLLGTFDAPDESVARRVSIGSLAPQLASVGGSLLVTLGLVGLAVAGLIPLWAMAFLMTAAFLGLVVSVYRLGEKLGPWATDETGQPRALLHRHGFWVVTVGTLLYLPMLGSYSLSDPWETHYGEVAREVLSRNDWISTWWAQDGWFWSKPVLNFWTEALSMAIFGAGYKPGQMLAAVGKGLNPWPEWAIRMPVFIMTVVALYLIYKGVAKVFGRRAGLLGALVLSTMPHWFFIAHQTMTDMPFVASMTSAMGLLLLGLHTDPEKELRTYELDLGITRFRLSAYHLVFGVILMSVLPQVLYLISRNLELQLIATPHGFRNHADVFFSGSAGNCGLPGNQECTRTLPANPDMQPWLQGGLWAAVTGLLLWANRSERRLSRVMFLAAWFFAAVSTMGKGPAGFLLPMLCVGAYIFATNKWKKLLDVEFPSGVLIILAVALPWYVAMFMRHGQPFTDRLIFHDMFKRAMVHVHDTNVGDDVSFRYFVWQLGYAMFPWVGLAPAGLVWWLRRREDAKGTGRGDVSVFLTMWFLFAFALFTAMLTKFHHYIFPAVPPAAMLTGILLDRMMGDRPLAKPGALWRYLATMITGAALTVYGFFRLFPGTLMGMKPEGGEPRAALPLLGIPLLLVGITILWFGIRTFGSQQDEPEQDPKLEERNAFEDALLGATGIAAAVLVGLVGYDLANHPAGDLPGQARLLFLFTYNYKRPWPDSLEFSGMIAAFALVSAALMCLLMVRKYRHHFTAILTIVGCLWAAWALDIYMVKTAPHWGQHETIAAYYKARTSPDQPLVAYQMNWKGENFYSSNQIPAFVSSGAKFKSWLDEERHKGKRTFFFVTEHGRIKGLQSELGKDVVSFEALTDRKLDNKFGLFKAVFGDLQPGKLPEGPIEENPPVEEGM